MSHYLLSNFYCDLLCRIKCTKPIRIVILHLLVSRYSTIRAKAMRLQLRRKKIYRDRIVAKSNNRKHSCRKRVQFVLYFRRIILRTKLITVSIQEPNKKLKCTYDTDSTRNSIRTEGVY